MPANPITRHPSPGSREAAGFPPAARKAVVTVLGRLNDLEGGILKNATLHFGDIIPAYEGLRRTRPVFWSSYMLSHLFKFQRTVEGLKDALKRSSAPCGTSPDPSGDMSAGLAEYGDDLCEIAFFMTQAMIHVSTLAEDVVLFNSREFGLVEMSDRVATGSSIMPHKKNPDLCELLRAKSGRAVGRLVSLLAVRKGLPGSAAPEVQGLKEIFAEALEETLRCLEMAGILVGAVAPAAKDWPDRESFLCVSRIVDYLVRKGMTESEAVDCVAAFVREARGDMAVFIELSAENFGLERGRVADMLKPAHAIAHRGPRNADPVSRTKRSFVRARKCLADNEKFINRLIEETPDDKLT